MSKGSENDNDPAEELPLYIECAHAVNALAHHEHSLRKMVMVPLPNGTTKPLGEVLMRLGAELKRLEDGVEKVKPRILLTTHSAIASAVRDLNGR